MLVTKLLPNSSASGVTLGTVMAMSGLSDVGVARADPDSVVHGACLAEGVDGTSSIEGGWLVATDGAVLDADADPRLRSFVRESAARGAAGIVVRLGHAWTDVPAPIHDEAGHAGLPILCLPAETTLSAFLRQVHETTGITDVAVLSAAMSMHAELIAALSAPDVEAELVRRLATNLNVSAILYDSDGDVIAMQGEAPVHMIGELAQQAEQPDERHAVGRWQVSISPISTGLAQRMLAIAWPQGRDVGGDLLRSSRFAVQQLLRAHAKTVASERLQDQVQRGQALGELLEGVTDARLLRMRDGLVLLHFPRESSYQVHLIESSDSGLSDSSLPGISEPDPLLLIVQDISASTTVPALMGRHGGSHAILHTASDAFTNELLERLPKATHGVSSSYTDLTSTPSALRQAQTSLSASRRNGQFTAFHRVGFVDFILGHLPEDTLRERTSEVLGELESNEAIMATLIEYLRCGLDIQRTGQNMHLHPNSIRYRLSRAEDHLGRSVSEPETITLLYLALHDRLTRTLGR